MELQKQAKIAIQTIGTNAIPTLLRMLKARDSRFKLKLIRLSHKQHLINIKWKLPQIRDNEAMLGFICLGSSAASAVPELVDIYKERRSHPYYDPYSGDPGGILYILALMGPAAADAVPRLVEDTTDTNSDVRFAAFWALGKIHAKPSFAVPALISSLRDPIFGNRVCAIIDLGAFGSDAKSAVPELIKLLADPSPAVRANAISALKKIDPEAAAQAGVK